MYKSKPKKKTTKKKPSQVKKRATPPGFHMMPNGTLMKGNKHKGNAKR